MINIRVNKIKYIGNKNVLNVKNKFLFVVKIY